MYISTMRRFVDGLGGELEITARFPEGAVVIDQFASLGKSSAPTKGIEMAHKKATGKKGGDEGLEDPPKQVDWKHVEIGRR